MKNNELLTKDLNVEKVEKLQYIDYLTTVTSLNYIDAEGEEAIHNVADDYDLLEEVSTIIDTEILLKDMKELLTPREYKVIIMRFGFAGRVMTLEEIGKKYKLTRERIRQIEAKALKKLKSHIKKESE